MYLVLGVFSVALLGGWALTYLYLHYALVNGHLAIPEARSSHQVPTPLGGGLSFVLVSAASLLAMLVTGRLGLSGSAFLWPVFALALLGYVDDHRHLGVPLRMALQIVLMVCSLALIRVISAQVPGAESHTDFAAVLYFGAILGLMLWLLNLYNFMDGTDGLATVEALCWAAVVVGLLYVADGEASRTVRAPGWVLYLLLSLFGSCAGFLYWNRAPARIFMGDVGSLFLGGLIASITVFLALQQHLSACISAIMLALFVIDATATLLRRLLRGERVWQAHRSHLYQRLALCKGHRFVAGLATLINVLWLAPWALLAHLYQGLAIICILFAYLPLVLLWLYCRDRY